MQSLNETQPRPAPEFQVAPVWIRMPEVSHLPSEAPTSGRGEVREPASATRDSRAGIQSLAALKGRIPPLAILGGMGAIVLLLIGLVFRGGDEKPPAIEQSAPPWDVRPAEVAEPTQSPQTQPQTAQPQQTQLIEQKGPAQASSAWPQPQPSAMDGHVGRPMADHRGQAAPNYPIPPQTHDGPYMQLPGQPMQGGMSAGGAAPEADPWPGRGGANIYEAQQFGRPPDAPPAAEFEGTIRKSELPAPDDRYRNF